MDTFLTLNNTHIWSIYGLPRVFLNPQKACGKKLETLFLSEYPDFFDSPEIPGDAIVGLFLFGDFIFMSKTWGEKRELYLNLGTQHYQKPKQLPACNAVFDTTINRQSKSENYVEPVHPYNYVLGKRLLYVNGLPSTKKGFQITDRSGANGLCSRREAQVV